MIDLEDYKPKQEILDLEDDVIELWYGKNAVEFVRLISQCSIIYNEQHNEIYYDLNNKLTCRYDLYNNNFSIEFLNGSFNDDIKITNLLISIVKDIFNYEIKHVW